MNYFPSMTWHTQGIRLTAPVQWRSLDGVMGAFWQAESQAGANGYYLADDPRLMIFFNDVAPKVRIANSDSDLITRYRPMTRAIYIPAGVPLWTGSQALHRFSHLNLHLHRDRLLRFLAPTIGRSAAMAALQRPVELQDLGPLETLARLLVDELDGPTRPAIYAESLVGSILAGLLDLSGGHDGQVSGRLTPVQMDRLQALAQERGSAKLSVAEMAASVGLSESWFGTVFKQTTGKSPLQWQIERRIEVARTLLVDSDMTVAAIAARLGFSDQAHLTKAFRQASGDTPAAWRRLHQSR